MTDEELSEAILKVFVPIDYTVECFNQSLKMHTVPLVIDKQMMSLRNKVKEDNENEDYIVDFYLISCDILLEYYKIDNLKVEDFVFEDVRKFVDTQFNIQNIEMIIVEEVERKYKVPETKQDKEEEERHKGLPEFVGWFSFAAELGQSISSILKTYTRGQLALMSLASRLMYMTPDQKKKFGAAIKKPDFKKATKQQIEEYYASMGF